jgi:hypothetical protein
VATGTGYKPSYIFKLILRRVSAHVSAIFRQSRHHHHHHPHHVYEGLGVFPVPWFSKWIWSLHLFLGRPMFLRPFGLYCNVCFGILFVSQSRLNC